MKFIVIAAALLAPMVAARQFTIFDDRNYEGTGHAENRPDGGPCWNLNGAGDRGSSVRGGSGCTTFFQQRDCTGASWKQRGNAATVPQFLEDHMWSYINSC
ncbi:hypothetical protein N0V90_000377 [Kalmusia sp. IMI 367209]|nr:hypothetical protein N0V90_000377 [Kalmusia sp. IMI 367209]